MTINSFIFYSFRRSILRLLSVILLLLFLWLFQGKLNEGARDRECARVFNLKKYTIYLNPLKVPHPQFTKYNAFERSLCITSSFTRFDDVFGNFCTFLPSRISGENKAAINGMGLSGAGGLRYH